MFTVRREHRFFCQLGKLPYPKREFLESLQTDLEDLKRDLKRKMNAIHRGKGQSSDIPHLSATYHQANRCPGYITFLQRVDTPKALQEHRDQQERDREQGNWQP